MTDVIFIRSILRTVWGPWMVSTRQRQVLALLAIPVMVTGALGCAGGDGADEDARTDPEAEETTTTAAASSSPPSTLTPEEAAEATYLELVELLYEMPSTNPDPDDPNLARLATDPVLSEIRENLTTMQAENHVVERGDSTTQEIRTVTLDSNGSAVVTVCSIGNDRVVDQDDGTVIEEGTSATLAEVTVVRHDDGWQVSDITALEVYEGRLECPA
jgi:hypothetical protein